MTHKQIYYNIDGEETISENDCPEEEFWDEVLEGYVCAKCHYSTSLK